MVTSIVPGTTNTAAFNVEPRNGRPSAPTPREQNGGVGDRVEINSATLNAARDSVRDGLMDVHQALAIGHDAQAMLLQVQALARAGGEGAQSQMTELLWGFAQRLEAAIADGATLAAGGDLAVQAEPGAAPVAIGGVDLRLGGAIISFDQNASAADPNLAQSAQRSLETLQAAMSSLLDSARALEAHQGFLGAAQGAAGVRHDVDTDGARLLALQVRQGLQGANGAAIANVEPQAVLSLFRA